MWTHEHASVMMFADLVNGDRFLTEQITESDQQFICDLILGKVIQKRSWISEIVSNSRNGVDVDKFDYLRRDT